MKFAYIILFAAFVAFFGCSEKKYFTPEVVSGEWKISGGLEDSIVQSNKNGALLENGTLITKDGIYRLGLSSEYLFLNVVGDVIIVANYATSTLSFLNKDGKELKSFAFEYMPLSANVRDNILAVVLSNNTTVLWDTNLDEELFSNKNSVVYVVNSKSAAPLFVGNEVIFPSLDGKLMAVDLNSLRITRDIALGSGSAFNNVIYLDVAEDSKNLIAATNTKVITIINDKDFSYNVNVIDILHKNGKIYVLSLEGEVIELDLLLNELHKKKFPFAALSTIVLDDSLYTLESQGYLIKIDVDNFVDSVYEIDIKEYKNSFYTDKIIYYDDEYIMFP